jgi:dipeptidyl aminopeptidase/acylaminoacyl peptidase
VYTCNTSGTCEIHAWDRRRDRHHQVTGRPHGTTFAALSPDGSQIWWFADTDGDEFGVWLAEPFEPPPSGGTAVPALPGAPPGYPAGLCVGYTTTVAGIATDDGTTVWVVDDTARVLATFDHDAEVVALSADDRLLAIVRDEGSGPVLEIRPVLGGPALTAWPGDSAGPTALGFSPVAGDQRLIVQYEHPSGTRLAIWDTETGVHQDILTDLPGELSAQWYPDGETLIVVRHHNARSTLQRFVVSTGEVSAVGTPPGKIDAVAVRPDNRVEYLWSSAEQSPTVRTSGTDGDRVLFAPPGDRPPAGPRLDDTWLPTPAGALHVLYARPLPRRASPTVFLLHGGPHGADEDRFSAYRSVWTDAGFAVVHVNYRGSTGYDRAWRDAIVGRPGLTELADVVTATEWAISEGIADPARCVLAGSSWGGYLTLLGLGRNPGLWAAGIAEAPIADHAAAYADRPDFLRSFDRMLFGGSPEERPERYAEASPISYVADVRAPVLIVTGVNDVRCPAGQIDAYLARLRDEGVPHRVHRHPAGHEPLAVAELVLQAALDVSFAAEALGVDING